MEEPEYTSVIVQTPLPGPEGPRPEESLLAPASPPEKLPEPFRERYHKLTEVLRRGSRAHRLVAVITALILTVVVFVVFHAVRSASHLSDERGRTAVSAAEDLKDKEVLPPCGDDWIWYRNKCYYFSEAEGNWTVAEASCNELDSSLATIDTQKELDFLMRYKGDPDHWIGLKRDSEKRWRWINGSEFNSWFPVADYSDYAYLNHRNVKSGDSYNTRHWICTKVSPYERKYKREKTLPSFL